MAAILVKPAEMAEEQTASEESEEHLKAQSSLENTNHSTSTSFHERDCEKTHSHERDPIFEDEDSGERGDNVEEEFRCEDVDVIWLADTERKSPSSSKESILFYPEVEVGANETATVVDAKSRQPDSPSLDLEPSGIDGVSNHKCPDEDLECSSTNAQEPSHDVAPQREQHLLQKCDTSWMNEKEQGECKMLRTPSNINQNLEGQAYPPSTIFSATSSTGERSMLHVSKSEPTESSVQFTVPLLQSGGIIPTNTTYLLQQPHVNYGDASSSIPSSVVPGSQISHNILPCYIASGLGLTPSLNFYRTADGNANIIHYPMGVQGRSDQYAPPFAFGSTSIAERMQAERLRTNVAHLQRPTNVSNFSVDALSAYSFLSHPQQPTFSTTLPLHQQYLNTLNNIKPCVLGGIKNAQEVEGNRIQSSVGVASDALPLNVPDASLIRSCSSEEQRKLVLLAHEVKGSLVAHAMQMGSAGTTYSTATQHGNSESQILDTALISQSSPKIGISTNAEGIVPQSSEPIKSCEDVVVFPAPRRLGISLGKQAHYAKRRSQTVDVLMQNTARSFDIPTDSSPKATSTSPLSPEFLGDKLSNSEKPRIHSYLSIVKYPNMVDVNFRRRSGVKTPSRPRHLCDQTREVVGRVCAYFREFSRRFAALGNNIAGTPFENPERMASHATGFTLPTIRRCGERMETIPPCTASAAKVPTEEELCNLSWIFSEEPWYIAQRARGKSATNPRKRPRRRAPSSPSISELEKDPEESEEQNIELDLELLESDDTEQEVPKRRRSERIRNQRRAKLLSRLKAMNASGKVRVSTLKNEKNAVTSGENTAATSDHQSRHFNWKRECELLSELPLCELGKESVRRRSRSADLQYLDGRRSYQTKRSSSIAEGEAAKSHVPNGDLRSIRYA